MVPVGEYIRHTHTHVCRIVELACSSKLHMSHENAVTNGTCGAVDMLLPSFTLKVEFIWREALSVKSLSKGSDVNKTEIGEARSC